MKPIFKDNYVTSVMSLNDAFIPYLSTFLLSVMENASESHSYDFIILHRDIKESSKKLMKQMIKNKKNFYIRFYDIGNRFDKYEMFLHEHFTIETYFRLLIPEILENYNKVLYLDADIIVNADLYDLLNQDISGYLLGAVMDITMLTFAGAYEETRRILRDTVKIDRTEEYFNAGVMVLNIPLLKKNFSTEYLLKTAASKEWPTVDQDVLNYLCKGRVKLLDMRWNLMFDYIGRMELMKKVLSKSYYNMYLEARMEPKIIHYAGCPKPWQIPEADFADCFWKYARQSPFYERIISNMSTFVWEREN